MILEILKAAITNSKSPDEAVKNIQKSLGGCDVYIPINDVSTRNKEILLMYNGRNHAEVCRKYNISLSTLYRVTN